MTLTPRQAVPPVPLAPVHPYHLVDVSPWPFIMAFSVFSGAVGLVAWLTHHAVNPLTFVPAILLVPTLWFRDIVREAKGGFHTTAVQKGIMIGFLLFLLSEIM